MKALIIATMCLMFSGCVIRLEEQPPKYNWDGIVSQVLTGVADIIEASK